VTERIGMTFLVPREALPEYERRHAEIWAELEASIAEHGGHNFSIFAAPALNLVFSYVEVDDLRLWQRSAATEVTQRWWTYMAEIMPTNPDFSPIAEELPLIFHLD
jgi:L-rhamnose mutarotase